MSWDSKLNETRGNVFDDVAEVRKIPFRVRSRCWSLFDVARILEAKKDGEKRRHMRRRLNRSVAFRGPCTVEVKLF